MTRSVDKARKAIKRRKQDREQRTMQDVRRQRQTIMPPITEEEKHGFEMPLHEISENPYKNKKTHTRSPSRLIQVVLSIALFGVAAVLLQMENHPFDKQASWLTQQLHDEFPFAKAHRWYVTNLGEPLALSPKGTMPSIEAPDRKVLPVGGQVVEAFNDTGTGIKISPEEKKSIVTSLDQGIVIFAGNESQTGQTVKVQHADGTSTTYGSLSTIDVHLYQVIQPNQRVGTFTPTEDNEVVFFSIEKDNQFIDPFQVIPVDDLP